MKEMTVRVMTPDQIIFEGKAGRAHACGLTGYFTVLPHHAPLVAILKDEEFYMEDMDGKYTYIAIDSGMIEVANNHIDVLAQDAVISDERHGATGKMKAQLQARREQNVKSRDQAIRSEMELYRLIQQANQSHH